MPPLSHWQKINPSPSQAPPMLPRNRIGTALIPGTNVELQLYQSGELFSIKIPGRGDLMNSRVHGSEKALAELACAKIARVKKPRLLVGGLGMGFTLAAALKTVGPAAEVVVAELVPEVVEWNRTLIGAPAGHPLADPRSSVYVGDVADLIRQSRRRLRRHSRWTSTTGPKRSSAQENDWLYSADGLRATRARAAARRRARSLVGEPGSHLQQAAAAGRVRRRRARRAPASRRQGAAARNLDSDVVSPGKSAP